MGVVGFGSWWCRSPYWALRRVVDLIVLCLRSERSKELEILVLRQQLQVLQRQVGRPRLQAVDRVPGAN
jgi:putative transposase